MRYLKVLALLVFFVLALTLFAQNMPALSKPLQIKMALFGTPWFSLTGPFYIWGLGAFLAGGVFSLAYFLADRIRLSRQLSACKSRLGSLEQEVNSLRNLPLEEHPKSSGENMETEQE
jgi:putative membrane protein